jgi:prepilin-type N-terminal cleavage/methylation domain-containing protein
MLMRFLSSIACSSRGSARGSQGFTLIELLVSIGIIGVVSAIVLVRYGSFDSATILKNTAYDIALGLREAQIKSVSVVRGPGGFDLAYGVSFTPGSTFYTAFRDTATSTLAQFNTGDEIILNYAFSGRTIRIADVCVLRTTDRNETCGLARLDVMFKRPEFNAIVYADNSAAGVDIDPIDIQQARIIVASTQNSAERFHVKVSRLGQISVCYEDSPNCQ